MKKLLYGFLVMLFVFGCNKKELEMLRSDNDALRLEAAELNARSVRLQSSLDDANATIDTLNATVDALIEKYNTDVTYLVNLYNALVEDYNALGDDLVEQSTYITQLENTISGYEASAEEDAEYIEELEDEIADLEIELANMQVAYNDLKRNVEIFHIIHELYNENDSGFDSNSSPFYQVDLTDFTEISKAFVVDAEKHGLDVTGFFGQSHTWQWMSEQEIADHPGAVGLSIYSCSPGTNLRYKESWWDGAGDLSRVVLTYHELGHGYLHLNHSANNNDIMYYSVSASTYEQFRLSTIRFFQYIDQNPFGCEQPNIVDTIECYFND